MRKSLITSVVALLTLLFAAESVFSQPYYWGRGRVYYPRVYYRPYYYPMYQTAYPMSSYSQPYSSPQYSSPSYSSSYGTSSYGTTMIGAYDNYFQPGTLRVAPGTTVQWVNRGRHMHTVTASDGSWDSGDLAPGAVFARTFDRPGTYSIYCRHHAKEGMVATVIVGGASVSSAY